MVFPLGIGLLENTGVRFSGDTMGEMLLLLCLPMPLILIGIFCTYQGVINAMRALSDKPIRYPLTIPFVK